MPCILTQNFFGQKKLFQIQCLADECWQCHMLNGLTGLMNMWLSANATFASCDAMTVHKVDSCTHMLWVTETTPKLTSDNSIIRDLIFIIPSFLLLLQPCYGPFSGTTRVSRCQKRTSGLYGAREDKQRQTHRPSGRAPLQPDFLKKAFTKRSAHRQHKAKLTTHKQATWTAAQYVCRDCNMVFLPLHIGKTQQNSAAHRHPEICSVYGTQQLGTKWTISTQADCPNISAHHGSSFQSCYVVT